MVLRTLLYVSHLSPTIVKNDDEIVYNFRTEVQL